MIEHVFGNISSIHLAGHIFTEHIVERIRVCGRLHSGSVDRRQYMKILKDSAELGTVELLLILAQFKTGQFCGVAYIDVFHDGISGLRLDL